MPTFIVKDPQTGQTVKLTGDSAPTEQELNDIFSQTGAQQALRSEQALQPQADQPVAPTPQESTIGQDLVKGIQSAPENQLGLVENVGSLVTGAIAEPIAGVAGIAQALNPFAEEGAGARAVKATREALTFQPKTEAGQQIQQSIGQGLSQASQLVTENILEPLGVDDLAGKTFEATGSPLAATVVESLPTALAELIPGGFALKKAKQVERSSKAARKLIADQLREGNPNIDLVTKTLDDSGKVVTNRAAKQAVDVLGGDIKAKQTVSVLENLNPASKSQVSKMLDIVEKSRREPIFGQTNRPSDILGESVANRAKAISKLNTKARSNIGKAAKILENKSINIESARDNFFREMQDLGVKFGMKDGRIKADFSDSTFVGGGADKIERIANAIRTGEMDGLSAHRQKQFIRDLVSFGKGTESAVSGRSEGILKRLASGIDNVLDETSGAYRKANEDFAKTIDLTEKFDKLAGKDVDIFSDLSNKALGGKARRLVSNAESRVAIEQNLLEADKVLSDFGVRFKDDIPSLSHAVTQLENIFKIEPPGSFQGRIQRGATNVAQGLSPAGTVTEAAIEKVFKLAEPDFNKKMKALRTLTKSKDK